MIGFVVGLFVGGTLGVLATALAVAAGRTYREGNAG